MATKKRKRKKSQSAKKTWRFIQKQRRRRKRLHPTRRKQENLAILSGVAALPLLVFIGIPAAVFAGVGAVFAGVASKGSPPPKTKTYKPASTKHKGDEKFSGVFSGRQALKLKQKATSCSDPCKYSTHDKSTCDCACGGNQHGIWAWGPSGTTTPNKVRKRRTTTTRRRRAPRRLGNYKG